MLVAIEQPRPESAEESTAHLLTKDTVLGGKQFAEKGEHQHKPEETPPVQRPKVRQLEIHDATISPQKVRRSSAAQETDSLRAGMQSGKEEFDEDGVWKDIDEQYDEYHRERNKRQANLRDDVPQSARAALQNQSQKKSKFEPQQLPLERLPAITMVGALDNGSQNGTASVQNK